MKNVLKKFVNFIKKSIRNRPMSSFFTVLLLLFVVIFIGHIIRRPDEVKKDDVSQAKETEVFAFGETPYLSLSAKVDKKNIITINATTSGVVKYINAHEGQEVGAGTVLVSLSDTYGGANVSAVDEKIAQKTKDIQDITYEKNEDILDYQKSEVPKSDHESNKIARKQVSVQERDLELGRDVIDLNLKKAKIANALHYPAAPTSGVVEKIHVRPGEQVQAGTPLVSFVSDLNAGTAEILISLQIAKMVSVEDVSYIHINGQKVVAHPIYISKESTSDQHYSVMYLVPKDYLDMIADKSYIKIDVPLENGEKNSAPMVPIDAVQLTQEKAYVFLLVDGKADSREVTLGNVYGQFVQVIEGIKVDDEIILNRNVFHGDNVEKVASSQ